MIQFSIITTSFNRAHILGETIASVLNQDYQNFEYIIVDDGSTDETPELIEKYKDDRLKYIKLPSNMERGFARNTGIKAASGEYITLLDSDDLIFTNHLTVAKKFIDSNPEISFFANGYEIVQQNHGGKKVVKYPTSNFIHSICKTNSFGLGIFISNSVAKQNLFNEDYNFNLAEDLYVWLKISSQYGVKFNPIVTGSCIRHDESTMNTLNPENVIYCRDKLIELLKSTPSFNENYDECFKDIYSNQTSLAILAYTIHGDYKIAFNKINNLLKEYPTEIIRKRTIVIFRNILINYLKQTQNNLKNYFFEDIWQVAYSKFDLGNLMNGQKIDCNWINVENQPKSYYADPFLIEYQSENLILTENFNLELQKGNIAVLKLDKNGKYTYYKSLTDDSSHFSYPTKFNWKGCQFFLCENSEKKELNLYQLNNDLSVTLTTKILQNTAVVDPNIFYDGQYFWLSFTDGQGLGNGHLYLYYATDVTLADWKPHKMNPVKISNTNSRGAGSWFLFNGKIYRPAQNCHKTYGKSIVINCITCLTPDAFRERKVREIKVTDLKIDSKAKITGTHTLNFLEQNLVIDFKYTAFTPLKIWNLLQKKLKLRFKH